MSEPSDIARREQIETDFWRNHPTQRPQSDSIDNVVRKMSEAAVLLDCLRRYREAFRSAGTILELGAGQGWAACIVKRMYARARVTATDISPHAVSSADKWQRMLSVRLNGVYACRAHETQLPPRSVDLVFAFASAHHFADLPATTAEIARILSPRGTGLLLYEPTSPRWLYKAAVRRVNRLRGDVPEDVLIPAEVCRLAGAAGLACRVDFYPSCLRRGPRQMLYYAVLARLTFLQRLLPCTANFVLTPEPAGQ